MLANQPQLGSAAMLALEVAPAMRQAHISGFMSAAAGYGQNVVQARKLPGHSLMTDTADGFVTFPNVQKIDGCDESHTKAGPASVALFSAYLRMCSTTSALFPPMRRRVCGKLRAMPRVISDAISQRFIAQSDTASCASGTHLLAMSDVIGPSFVWMGRTVGGEIIAASIGMGDKAGAVIASLADPPSVMGLTQTTVGTDTLRAHRSHLFGVGARACHKHAPRSYYTSFSPAKFGTTSGHVRAALAAYTETQ